MTNYTKTTDFAAKDSLPSGDSGKIIRGSEFETEFDNIATAVNSKSDANNPTFTGTVTIDGLTVNGNTVLGNAATDTVTVTADIASNLLPSADDTYNLGAVGAEWNDLHVDGTAYIDDISGGSISGTSFASTGNMTFGDNNEIKMGDTGQFRIFTNGSDSRIQENYSGNLRLLADDIILQSYSGETYFRGLANGQTNLYYDSNSKLATTSTGVDVTGSVTADGLTSSGVIKTEGTSLGFVLNETDTTDLNSYMYLQSGNLRFTTTNDAFNSFDTRMLISNSTGDISFYEDTGTTAKLTWDASAESLNFADNGKAVFGAGSDLQIYHDGTNSYINEVGTGNLNINANRFVVATGAPNYEYMMQALPDGGVLLYHNNLQKLATTFEGIDVTGTVTADGMTLGTITSGTPNHTLNVGGELAVINVNGANPTDAGSFYWKESGTTWGTDMFGARARYDGSSNVLKFEWCNLTNTGLNLALERDTGNVGIGTSSPKTQLDIATGTSSAAGPELTLTNGYAALTTGDRVGAINFYTSDASNRGPNNSAVIEAQAATTLGHDANLVFKTGVPVSEGQDAVETMRIDYQGNLLVGTTTLAPATLGNTSGAHIYPSGQAQFSQDNTASLVLNRKTSDGTIAEFRKDGAIVGFVGVSSVNNLTVGSSTVGHAGLELGNQFLPLNAGAASDGELDLGTTNRRFKDLYLSGGAYLGGNAAANKLDDYEEGTWTPVYQPGAGAFTTLTMDTPTAEYTKVGQLVVCRAIVRTDNVVVGTASGVLRIGGLPFNPDNFGGTVSIGYATGFASNTPMSGYIDNNSPYVTLTGRTAVGGSFDATDVSDMTTGASADKNYLILTFTYFTNS